MRYLITLLTVLIIGGCSIEDMFFPETAAPWETVDAYYYPNKNDLTISIKSSGHPTVDDCRRWVEGQAKRDYDPKLLRSDYECGVGLVEYYGPVGIYRLTVN